MTSIYPNGALTDSQVAAIAKGVGFTGDNLTIATAVALAESGGVSNGTPHVNDNGTHDTGLWQINSAHTDYTTAGMMIPFANGQAAYAISGNGTDFTPWTRYRNGDYQQFMKRAAIGVAGIPSVNSANETDLGQTDPQGITGGIATGIAKATGLDAIGNLANKLLDVNLWKRSGIVILGLIILLLGFVLMMGSSKTVSGVAEKVALT